jgi:hypothetical protein
MRVMRVPSGTSLVFSFRATPTMQWYLLIQKEKIIKLYIKKSIPKKG